MFLLRRVAGQSMLPAFRPGQLVVISGRRRLRPGVIVVFRYGGEEYIKRLDRIRNGRMFVLGDNPATSTDSREFGGLDLDAVLGVVVWPRR